MPRSIVLGVFLLAFGLTASCGISFESACEDGGCGGESGGTKGASGGGSSEVSSGGLGGSGGFAGGSDIGGQGAGKDMGGTLGEQSMAPARPSLVEVLVGGQTLEDGETRIGLDDGPEVVFRFDTPMNKRSVEAAYSSRNPATSAEHVAFSWNERADELRVVPLTALKHAEVTEPNAEVELFTIALASTAKSQVGLELARPFQGSFQLRKRVTYFVLPDLENSLWATRAGAREPMISEEGLYPDHQWFLCPFWEDEDRPAEAGPLLLGYAPLRDNYVSYQSLVILDAGQPELRSVGVYAFPLPSDVLALEDASLMLVKWLGNGGSEAEALNSADFSVDVLSSVETSSATVGALRDDLVSSDGNDRNVGYGPFEFDVTDVVAEGIAEADAWSIYRVGFEEVSEPYQTIVACAAASLTLVYWAH